MSYLVNNTPLDTYATALSVDEGLQEAPARRETDVPVPTMHGELDVGSDPSASRRSFGPGQITFSGWVKGVDPDTGRWSPGGTEADYFARVSALMRMFYARSLVLEHQRPDGNRRAVGHLLGALAPARERTSPWFGRWKAVVKVPAAFWEAVSPVTVSASVATGGALPLGPLAAGEAPIADPLLTFGPGSNPTLLQGGVFIAYDAIIAPGRQLTVDVGSYELGIGSGSVWTPDDSKIRYGPGPSWFEIDPTGSAAAALNHTGGGQMYAAITARPKYLTS